MTITPGETDASTSTIAPADLNNTQLVVGSTLVVQIFGKDKLGGQSEDQDFFFLKYKKTTKLVNGVEKSCGGIPGGCEEGQGVFHRYDRPRRPEAVLQPPQVPAVAVPLLLLVLLSTLVAVKERVQWR